MDAPKVPTKPDVSAPPMAPRPDAVQLRARRSPRLVALGVLAVALGGLGGAVLYSGATQQQSAVAMARDVPRGQEITQADLSIVTVPAGLEIETMSGSAMADLVGKRALTDLPAGSFPASRHLGTPKVSSGQSLVGLKLAQGRMPVADLPQGTRVQLVSLVEGTAPVIEAEVASQPTASDDGSGLVLDVVVADGSAAQVAALAAADKLALVAVGDG